MGITMVGDIFHFTMAEFVGPACLRKQQKHMCIRLSQEYFFPGSGTIHTM